MYPKGRVQRDEPLPEAEVKGGHGGEEGERLAAVARYDRAAKRPSWPSSCR